MSRLLWRAVPEVALGVYALALAGVLVERGAQSWAAGVLGVAGGALGFVGAELGRRGVWRLARRCPRVDALGAPPPRTPEAWKVVDAAEHVLELLASHAKGYRDFLPDARRQIQEALRSGLREGASECELEALERTLRTIAASLETAAQLGRSPEARPSLEPLRTRATALAEAASELAPTAAVLQFSRRQRP